MKKIISIFALCAIIVTSLFVLTACDKKPSGGEDVPEIITEDKAAHNSYSVKTVQKGEKPLSYAEWIESLKGESETEPTFTLDEDGFWIINGEKTEYYTVDKEKNPEVGGLVFDLVGGNYEVTGLDEDSASATIIVIPETFKGKSVTRIKGDAFNGTLLETVVIGSNVKEIGYQAFMSCDSLIYVNIPDSVTIIGNSAFESCTALLSITIGDGVTSLYSSFRGCSNLLRVTIGKSVERIETKAFSYCSKLTEIKIPDGVTIIGSEAFSACMSLTTVIIPKSVRVIEKKAFYMCKQIGIVYFEGVLSEWKSMSIATKNDQMTSRPRYYYSEETPTTSGRYWRYVDGVPTAW